MTELEQIYFYINGVMPCYVTIYDDPDESDESYESDDLKYCLMVVD